MRNFYQSLTAFTAIFAILFSFNLAANPSGHKGHPGYAEKGGKHRMMTAKKILMHLAPLNLNDQQVESIKQLVKKGQQQSKPLKKQLKQQHS